VSNLLRSNVTVATGTALSRLTGLVRVAVFVYVIGRTGLADVYTIANETPNIVYELLLGGVLSATLVPLFTSFLEHDDDEATNVVITVAVTLLTAITAVAVLAAPLIFRIYSITPSEDVDAALLREVGTTLTRIFLVQILFYGLTGVANAFLNSRRRFFAAAWSPILPNLVIIATLLSLPGAGETEWELGDVLTDDRLRWTLGLGATAGIAAMALVLVPAVWRTGYHFRPAWTWRHPAVRRLLVLSGWTLGYVVSNQVALAFVRNLAEPGSGDAAAYFYAFTFFVLPHGLLAVSIATTFQPEMARAVSRRDRDGFIHHASLGTRMVALLTMPAGVAIFVLRQPIIGFTLQRGNFDAADTADTARALAGFSLGLVGFSVYLFVLRGFYAHDDARTPFIINLFENVINIVLAFVLVEEYGVLGLGLAFAIAYLVASVWALQVMSYKLRGFPVATTLLALGKMLVAALVMAEVTWLVARVVGDNTGMGALARVAAAGAAGLVAYVAVAILVRVPHLDELWGRLVRSKRAAA
jgi:putative peptidoglycan lipid II flippase